MCVCGSHMMYVYIHHLQGCASCMPLIVYTQGYYAYECVCLCVHACVYRCMCTWVPGIYRYAYSYVCTLLSLSSHSAFLISVTGAVTQEWVEYGPANAQPGPDAQKTSILSTESRCVLSHTQGRGQQRSLVRRGLSLLPVLCNRGLLVTFEQE